jgi:hypothetical protein
MPFILKQARVELRTHENSESLSKITFDQKENSRIIVVCTLTVGGLGRIKNTESARRE